MNDDARGTVIGLSAMALCIVVGAGIGVAAYGDVGDDCMIPLGFLAWVAGAAGAVAGGGIGLVLACVLSLTDAAARLDAFHDKGSVAQPPASAVLMRPVESSTAEQTLMRSVQARGASDHLLRPLE